MHVLVGLAIALGIIYALVACLGTPGGRVFLLVLALLGSATWIYGVHDKQQHEAEEAARNSLVYAAPTVTQSPSKTVSSRRICGLLPGDTNHPDRVTPCRAATVEDLPSARQNVLTYRYNVKLSANAADALRELAALEGR